MNPLLERVLTKIVEYWEYDMAAFSHGWMYWWLLIPAMVYLAFFMIKWAVITAPVWIPFHLIALAFKSTPKNEDKEDE